MPTKTVRGERLAEPPAIESPTRFRKTWRLARSPIVSGRRDDSCALAGKYQADDHIQFISPVAPNETRAHPGGALVYRVAQSRCQEAGVA